MSTFTSFIESKNSLEGIRNIQEALIRLFGVNNAKITRNSPILKKTVSQMIGIYDEASWRITDFDNGIVMINTLPELEKQGKRMYKGMMVDIVSGLIVRQGIKYNNCYTYDELPINAANMFVFGSKPISTSGLEITKGIDGTYVSLTKINGIHNLSSNKNVNIIKNWYGDDHITFEEIYKSLGGPDASNPPKEMEAFFDDNTITFPYAFNFLLNSPKLQNSNRQKSSAGFLVYLGKTPFVYPNGNVWPNPKDLSNEAKESPYKFYSDLNINTDELENDPRPNAGLILPEIFAAVEPKSTSELTIDNKEPYCHKIQNISIEEANAFLKYGFDDKVKCDEIYPTTDKRLRSGEFVNIYNPATSHLYTIRSTANSYREKMNDDREGNSEAFLIGLLNYAFLNMSEREDIKTFYDAFPIINIKKVMELEDIDNIPIPPNMKTFSDEIYIANSNNSNDFEAQNRSIEYMMFNIWYCYMISISREKRIKVAPLYKNFINDIDNLAVKFYDAIVEGKQQPQHDYSNIFKGIMKVIKKTNKNPDLVFIKNFIYKQCDMAKVIGLAKSVILVSEPVIKASDLITEMTESAVESSKKDLTKTNERDVGTGISVTIDIPSGQNSESEMTQILKSISESISESILTPILDTVSEYA